jgi:hypothetical protein
MSTLPTPSSPDGPIPPGANGQWVGTLLSLARDVIYAPSWSPWIRFMLTVVVGAGIYALFLVLP